MPIPSSKTDSQNNSIISNHDFQKKMQNVQRNYVNNVNVQHFRASQNEPINIVAKQSHHDFVCARLAATQSNQKSQKDANSPIIHFEPTANVNFTTIFTTTTRYVGSWCDLLHPAIWFLSFHGRQRRRDVHQHQQRILRL